MSHRTTIPRRYSRKFLVVSLGTAAVLAVTRPLLSVKAYAAGNQYDWVKQVDQDLKGGNYTSVASSADGKHMIVGSQEGGEGFNEASPLYVSSNYGTTWTNVTDSADHRIRDYWKSVDVSDDGQTMIAASDQGINLHDLTSTDGKIFISHNAGSTWTNITPASKTQWEAVALSGDGSKIVAVANDDTSNIYLSSDGGSHWTTKAATHAVHYWSTAAMSDNGDTVMVGGENTAGLTSLVDLSTDGGANWADVSPDTGNLVFTSRIAMNSDGSELAVSSFAWNGSSEYDKVYKSTDDGAHWTDVSPVDADVNQWSALAISGNGAMMAVQDANDKMYISSDHGANWTVEDPGLADNDTDNWRSIDFNDSGSRIVTASDALAYTGYDAALDDFALVANAENGKTIELTTPGGTTITCHSAVKESSLSAQDGGYSYPLGLVDFCFSTADASNGITLLFVTDLKPDQVVVRKYNPHTKQYATISGAHVTETTLDGHHALRVTYTIVDNGSLDTNATDGEVSDPVGLAVAGAPNTGFGEPTSRSSSPAILVGAGLVAGLLALAVRRKTSSRMASKK